MIFSLDFVMENSELNLIQTSFLSILIKSFQLKLIDKLSYQFCDQIP